MPESGSLATCLSVQEVEESSNNIKHLPSSNCVPIRGSFEILVFLWRPCARIWLTPVVWSDSEDRGQEREVRTETLQRSWTLERRISVLSSSSNASASNANSLETETKQITSLSRNRVRRKATVQSLTGTWRRRQVPFVGTWTMCLPIVMFYYTKWYTMVFSKCSVLTCHRSQVVRFERVRFEFRISQVTMVPRSPRRRHKRFVKNRAENHRKLALKSEMKSKSVCI